MKQQQQHVLFCTNILFRLASFHKKTDAFIVSLVLNAEGKSIYGPGYAHREMPHKLAGTQAYPAIFCYPTDCLVSSELVIISIADHTRHLQPAHILGA